MSEVRQQVLIEAPPEAVWALITDVNRHPDWWPDVEEVHCDDFHEGCQYREVIKVPLGTAKREFVVSEATDCQRFRIDCVVSGAFVRTASASASDGRESISTSLPSIFSVIEA